MTVKNDSVVRFHYAGKFENGDVFTSTLGKEPFECKLGEFKLLKGIEEGLIGMQEAERKEIIVPPEKGFGRRDENRVMKLSKKVIQGSNARIGQFVGVKDEKGNVFEGEMLAIEADSVTFDFNHPLAGKTLKFDIEVLEAH